LRKSLKRNQAEVAMKRARMADELEKKLEEAQIVLSTAKHQSKKVPKSDVYACRHCMVRVRFMVLVFLMILSMRKICFYSFSLVRSIDCAAHCIVAQLP
jgi:hypothetical protein